MSANNKLYIYKNKGKYLIKNMDVDSGGFFIEGETKTFKEARALAKEIMSEESVEYGIDYNENCFEKDSK